MNKNLKYIDGGLIEIGPSQEVNRLTQIDYLKIEPDSGDDIFLPNCMSKERMTSYLHEALGKKSRIFYVQAILSPTSTITTILGIEIDQAKGFSEANNLDNDLILVGKMLFKRKLKFWALLILTIFFFALVVTLPLGVVSAVPTYYAYRDYKKLQRNVAVIPSKLEFEKFYLENSSRKNTPFSA